MNLKGIGTCEQDIIKALAETVEHLRKTRPALASALESCKLDYTGFILKCEDQDYFEILNNSLSLVTCSIFEKLGGKTDLIVSRG